MLKKDALFTFIKLRKFMHIGDETLLKFLLLKTFMKRISMKLNQLNDYDTNHIILVILS